MKDVLAVLAAGGTVLTANNRLARSVTLAWNRRQRAAGEQVWRTPAVLAWRTFISALHGSSAMGGGQAGRRLLLTDSQSRLLWRRIISTTTNGLLPGAASPMADTAWQAWQLLQDWRIPVATLAAVADSEDTRAFAAWAAQYQQQCAAADWADAPTAAALLLEDLRAGFLDAPVRLHLAGFAERTPLLEAMLHALAGRGCVISEDTAQPRGPLDLSHRRCADADTELDEAAWWARRHREADPLARVGIVVPDLAGRASAVRRRVLDILAPGWRLEPGQPVPVNFSYGQPLADIGLARTALLVLAAVTGRLDYRHAGELLTTRYLPGHAGEASARARIGLALRERVGTGVPLAELIACTSAEAPELSRRLAALATRAGQLPQHQPPGRWASSFRLLLEDMGWPGDVALASDEFQAATAWQDLLDRLRSCDAILGPLDGEGALGVVRELALGQLFQPAGDPDAIQVLGVMEAVGQHFDALWVCGMTSTAWPPPARSQPLLPLRLQREHRLPGSSPALARERAERLLRWLETGARQVVFSSPAFEGDEPLAPSPLIARLAAAGTGVALPQGSRWLDRMPGATRLEVLAEDPPPPVAAGVRLRGGASLLEREARCPARAFVEFRLGARALAVPAPGIDAPTRGRITHHALQVFFSGVDSHELLVSLPADERLRRLGSAVDAALHAILPAQDPLLRRLAANERGRQLELLGRFLELEGQREGFRVLGTELSPPDARLPPALARLQMRLRIDRIDEMPDGRRLVIDYKTGQQLPPAGEWYKRLRAPQLPLYATLTDADGIAFVQLSAGRLGWRGVAASDWGIRGMVCAEDLTGGELTEWGALRAWWHSALERLAGEFLAGCFDVDRWQQQEARGEWAMAIRSYELGELGEDDA